MENKMSSFDREEIEKETNIKGEINSLYFLYFLSISIHLFTSYLFLFSIFNQNTSTFTLFLNLILPICYLQFIFFPFLTI